MEEKEKKEENLEESLNPNENTKDQPVKTRWIILIIFVCWLVSMGLAIGNVVKNQEDKPDFSDSISWNTSQTFFDFGTDIESNQQTMIFQTFEETDNWLFSLHEEGRYTETDDNDAWSRTEEYEVFHSTLLKYNENLVYIDFIYTDLLRDYDFFINADFVYVEGINILSVDDVGLSLFKYDCIIYEYFNFSKVPKGEFYAITGKRDLKEIPEEKFDEFWISVQPDVYTSYTLDSGFEPYSLSVGMFELVQ